MAGSLVDMSAPTTLEDALSGQASNAITASQDKYTQARKRQVSQLAANGQLMGGTADYPLGDLAMQGAQEQSGIYSDLASALGGIPAEDALDQNQNARNTQLAQLIASFNKPSALQEGLSTVGTLTHIFCGGYVENQCSIVDNKTGERGIMAEKGPELIIRLDTLGLTKKDIQDLGLHGSMAGFDANKVTDKQIRHLIRIGLGRIKE